MLGSLLSCKTTCVTCAFLTKLLLSCSGLFEAQIQGRWSACLLGSTLQTNQCCLGVLHCRGETILRKSLLLIDRISIAFHSLQACQHPNAFQCLPHYAGLCHHSCYIRYHVNWSLQMSVLHRCLKPTAGNPIPQTLWQQCFQALTTAWRLKRLLLSDLWPVLLVPTCFAGFVVWNGGIVVGDKTAHAPVKHLMQPLYFALFANVALGQFLFGPSR